MRLIALVLAAHAALAAITTYGATAAAADSIVPIDEEPRHRLMFENPHVRFFDVQLEPGYLSRWHSHMHDGVFINLAASETSAQDYGAESVSRPPRTIGETYFINYTRKPKAHRVSNTGNTPYRVVDTEILRGCGEYKSIAGSEGEVLVDNDRVRVTRLVLDPGQSARLNPPCGMLVAITEGQVRWRTTGGDALLNLRPGNFQWRQSAGQVEITNMGIAAVHAVDVLVK